MIYFLIIILLPENKPELNLNPFETGNQFIMEFLVPIILLFKSYFLESVTNADVNSMPVPRIKSEPGPRAKHQAAIWIRVISIIIPAIPVTQWKSVTTF